MKKIFVVMMLGVIVWGRDVGSGRSEKYVGQYQVTGVPLIITVTTDGGEAGDTGYGATEDGFCWSRARISREISIVLRADKQGPGGYLSIEFFGEKAS
ncbi:MAG: hypothetical protein ABR535_07080 [Pyrinomonadaceae bacterium]